MRYLLLELLEARSDLRVERRPLFGVDERNAGIYFSYVGNRSAFGSHAGENRFGGRRLAEREAVDVWAAELEECFLRVKKFEAWIADAAEFGLIGKRVELPPGEFPPTHLPYK